MSKQLVLNKQQQAEFSARINQEMEKVTMSWDPELRQWHSIAKKALGHASIVDLNIPQEQYFRLFQEDTHGLNMNVVMVLNNLIERTVPANIGASIEEWNDIIALNIRVAVRWNGLHKPIHDKVFREFEIMAGRPKMVIAEA